MRIGIAAQFVEAAFGSGIQLPHRPPLAMTGPFSGGVECPNRAAFAMAPHACEYVNRGSDARVLDQALTADTASCQERGPRSWLAVLRLGPLRQQVPGTAAVSGSEPSPDLALLDGRAPQLGTSTNIWATGSLGQRVSMAGAS